MMPLFQGGAIEAQIAYQNAEAQAALANYGKVVLNAFGEVENALNGEMTWRERSVLLNAQLQEQKQILRRIEQEFTIGRVDQRQIQQECLHQTDVHPPGDQRNQEHDQRQLKTDGVGDASFDGTGA